MNWRHFLLSKKISSKRSGREKLDKSFTGSYKKSNYISIMGNIHS
jgi:hypothetical protein